MRVYLIRHAEARHQAAGAIALDPLRPLTRRGRRRFRRNALAFASRGEKIDALYASPTLRAVQTAQLLASAMAHLPVAVIDELLPHAPASEVRDWLAEQRVHSVALVGHRHQLRDLALLLAGPDARLELKKGAIERIEVTRRHLRTRRRRAVGRER